MVREGCHDQRVNLILVSAAADSLEIALIEVAEIRVVGNQPLIESLPELLHAIAQRVTCPEAGSVLQFVETDAIVPAVGIIDVLDPNVRECIPNDVRDLSDGMIQSRIAHIKDLPAHQLDRRFERSNRCLYQIANVERPGMSNHALRHTAGTLGYLHTGDRRAVQDFLGHADPRMTAKYAHVVDMAKKNPALFIPAKVG
jgi:hypothetical protein